MKKSTWICLLVAVVVLAGLVVYCNSYGIALRSAGLSKSSIQYLDAGIDDNGQEYRAVFQYRTDDDAIDFALLTKDKLGVWHTTQKSAWPGSDASYSTFAWMNVAGMKRYAVGDATTTEFEVHNVYAGNNAIKLIEIPQEALPSNVTVNVHQAGALFVIHLVYYGEDVDTLNINFPETLKQAGCIS